MRKYETRSNENTLINIKNEAKNIAASLNIDDITECMAKRQAFITLKGLFKR